MSIKVTLLKEKLIKVHYMYANNNLNSSFTRLGSTKYDHIMTITVWYSLQEPVAYK